MVRELPMYGNYVLSALCLLGTAYAEDGNSKGPVLKSFTKVLISPLQD